MSSNGSPSPVEQGASEVSGPKSRELTRGQKIGLAVLIAIVGLGFIWFNAMLKRHAPAAEKTVAAAATTGEKYTPPPAPPTPAATTAALLLPAADASDVGLTGRPATNPPPILAYSGEVAPHPAAPGAASGTATGSGDLAGSNSGSPQPTAPADTSNLSGKLKATVLVGTQASLIKNPDLTITEGTLMPCIMQTATETEQMGFVTCMIPVDVRGTSGNVVLLDRGTKVFGQIQSGLVQGQTRVFVLWTRAETPHHVVISMNAPGTDELGRTGLPGAVNNHWWDRFGGALMLTLVQGSLNAGTALAANSGSGGSNEAALGFVYSGQSAGQQVANTALENSINIPPTLDKNQGDTVSVMTVQDMDFTPVYRLRPAGTRP